MKRFTFGKVATSYNFTKNELFHRYYFANANGYFLSIIQNLRTAIFKENTT